MKIECVTKPKGKTPGLYLVKEGEVIIGQLEKYNNNRTETHPWKAFSGTGFARRYLGAFYNHEHGGKGKEAALDAIIKEWR